MSINYEYIFYRERYAKRTLRSSVDGQYHVSWFIRTRNAMPPHLISVSFSFYFSFISFKRPFMIPIESAGGQIVIDFEIYYRVRSLQFIQRQQSPMLSIALCIFPIEFQSAFIVKWSMLIRRLGAASLYCQWSIGALNRFNLQLNVFLFLSLASYSVFVFGVRYEF